MTGAPLSIAAYRGLTALAEPLAPWLLSRRAAKGKEERGRLAERLGRASIPRPEGPLVWLHGVSVGESLSLLPVVERIRAETPKTTILVTSGTVTSAHLLARRLPDGVIHQFAPVDGPRATARFLGHWRPQAALFAESELWPNLILGARARGVKLGLISARITEKSARAWARRPAAARALLGAFDLILPQDKASSLRLRDLGAAPGPILNLKYVAAPLAATAERLPLAGRRMLLAASTHPGEETLIAGASPPGVLLVIAPRHPDRGAAVEAQIKALGRKVARRSTGEPLTPDTDVYIADTLGEMGMLFSQADAAVIGGSFTPGVGGHNPLEPARLGVPAVSGPDVFNFADVYAEMAREGAVTIADADALPSAIARLLADDRAAGIQADAARAYAQAQRASFDAGWALVRELLP
jgi:3-deoxy-D-manno-octulosonic-acid transferase